MNVTGVELSSTTDEQPLLAEGDGNGACPGSDSACSTDDNDERLGRSNTRILSNVIQEPTQAPWGHVAMKIALTLLGFLVVMIVLETFCEEFVSDMCKTIMSCIGLLGLFLVVFLADGIPQPFTYAPLIFVAVKGAVSKPAVFFICVAGSYSAALVGYAIGLNLRNLSCGDALFNKLVQTYPYVPDLMQRRGAVGVALAALLPMPLAVATWTAGSFRVHFPHLLMAGLCRAPKIAVFVLLSPGPSPGPQQPQAAAQDAAMGSTAPRLIVVES